MNYAPSYRLLAAMMAIMLIPSVLPMHADEDAARFDLGAELRRQIGYCWRGAENLSKPERVSVVLRFQLTPSGELDGDVTLVSPEADEVSAVAISRATDAILNCAPYNLPKEHYHIWEDVEVTIGPPKNNLVS